MRDRHVVRGVGSADRPYEGETVYAWTPATRRVEFTYWSSDGMTSTGTVAPADGAVVFSMRAPMATTVLEIRSTWTRTGADGYRVVTEQRDGASWTPLWRTDFARKR